MRLENLSDLKKNLSSSGGSEGLTRRGLSDRKLLEIFILLLEGGANLAY